jgi:hypothetical protein
MKITNHGVTNPLVGPKPKVEDAAVVPGDAAAQGLAATDEGYTPSAELRQLLDLVAQEPEVRADRIQQVQQRLAQGHYETPVSTEETAAAILTALD